MGSGVSSGDALASRTRSIRVQNRQFCCKEILSQVQPSRSWPGHGMYKWHRKEMRWYHWNHQDDISVVQVGSLLKTASMGMYPRFFDVPDFIQRCWHCIIWKCDTRSRRTSVSPKDTTTVWNWLWTACSTNLVSASSCVDFGGPKSVAPVDDLNSSSSLNSPATTIYLSTGACEHNSSDKKCARSALLSANDSKFDQLFGRGTSRPSTSRLIGRAVLLRRVLVVPRICRTQHQFCDIQSLLSALSSLISIWARSPKVTAASGFPRATTSACLSMIRNDDVAWSWIVSGQSMSSLLHYISYKVANFGELFLRTGS